MKNHQLNPEICTLLHYHNQQILESGLLLDEDLEVLLENCNTDSHVIINNSYKISKKLLICAFSLSTGVLLTKTCKSIFFLCPPTIYSIWTSFSVLHNILHERRCKRNIKNLIESFQNLNKLNNQIINYLKIRREVSSAKDREYFAPVNKNLEVLMDTLLSEEIQVLLNIKECIKHFCKIIPILNDDFMFLENIELTDINSENITSIEDCSRILQKLRDISVLFTSKFLGYLGLLFCPKLSHITSPDLKNILDKVIPKTETIVNDFCSCVKKRFNDVRYASNKIVDTKNKIKDNKRIMSNKLQQALLYSATNISIILEKSQRIVNTLESVNSEKGFKEMGDAIQDLRDHTFATYESLDVLCKLYGILSNSSLKSVKTTNKVGQENGEEIKSIDKSDVVQVNFDDEMEESGDLKLELYIGEDDPDDFFVTSGYEEDQSGAYLGLMLQELKQSLKQHQAFIEARNKWGTDDSDVKLVEEVKNQKKEKWRPKTPPQFEDVVDDGVVKEPPKPPPSPPLSLPSVDSKEAPGVGSMLDNIKAMSSQRNVKEEVFGDSDDGEDC